MDGMPPTARLLGIGSFVAVCIVLGTLGGRELDKALDTEPILTVVGLLVGLFLAIWGSVHQLLDVMAAINRRQTGGKQE